MKKILLIIYKVLIFAHLFWALSSAGSEHLPYKQGVAGSNPAGPTCKTLGLLGFFIIVFYLALDLFSMKFTYVYIFQFVILFSSYSQSKISGILSDIPGHVEKRIETIINDNNFSGVFYSGDVDYISSELDMSLDQVIELLTPLSRTYAKAPISNYMVGAVCSGSSGNVYFGSNIEILGESLSFTLHAEQSAVVNAWLHGETNINFINVGGSPCGYCLQFLNELNQVDSLIIINPKGKNYIISDLLTLPFGPKNLGIDGGLMSKNDNNLILENDSRDRLVLAALNAANMSYAPYSKGYSGIAVMTEDGNIFQGYYAENAAFNPSISPIEFVLSSLNLSGKSFNQIKKVVLVEKRSSKSSQINTVKAVLNKIVPHVKLNVVYCNEME